MATAKGNRGAGRFAGLLLLGMAALACSSVRGDDGFAPVVRFVTDADQSETLAPLAGKPSAAAPNSNGVTTRSAAISFSAETPVASRRKSTLVSAPVVAAQAHLPGFAAPLWRQPDSPFANDPVQPEPLPSGPSSISTFDPQLPAPDAEPITGLPASHPAYRKMPSPGGPSEAHFGGTFAAFPTRDVIDLQTTPDPRHDRVLDLLPDGNDRQLVEQVREAVQQTELGVDTTGERWITVRGGQRITWGGRIETDYVNWANDAEFGTPVPPANPLDPPRPGQQDYVEFRRLRFFAAGEGYGVFDYQLEFDFAENEVRVKDAFIGMSDLPLLGYAVLGHFRVPISLENRTSTRFIPFMERSLPIRLLPGRELGVSAFNRSAKFNTTWSLGAFFDDIDERDKAIIDDNQGTRAVARWTWTPFFDELSGGRCFLHTGVGYMYTRPRRRLQVLNPGSKYRPVAFDARPEIDRGDPLISTGEINVDQFHTGNVELALANGPVTLQSELTWTSLEESSGGAENLYGAYAYLSWFLTGERRPYNRDFAVFGRVIPYENFWIVNTGQGQQAGWGAWELACRWSYLSFADVNNQNLTDLTVGLNWYWNPDTRMMINWIHPFAHNSPVATIPDTDAEGDIISLRMAVDF